MADNVSVNEGADKAIATDDVGGAHFQKIKLDVGGDGVSSPLVRGQQAEADSIPVVLPATQEPQTNALTDTELRATPVDVDITNASVTVDDGGTTISVDDGAGSLTVDGTVAVSNFPATQPVSGTVEVTNDAGNPLPVSGTVSVNEPVSVDDNGGSLTVDGTVTADAGTGPWPVTDNGGSLTVDATNLDIRDLSAAADSVTIEPGVNPIAISGTITADFVGDTADLDSGAGTDSHEVIAIGLPGAGGHVVGGTSTNPLRTDPTGTTTQPVSDGGGSLTVDGTVTANAGTGPWPVTDNGGSLTVDGTVAISNFPATQPVSGTVTADTELTTEDYDTGAGTDTVAAVGILLPKAGGAVAGGTSTDPIRTDPTGTTAQPVTDNGGSLTVDDGGTTLSVDDGGGSLTIDGTVSVTEPVSVEGNAADGAAPSGNPVLVAGQDGTNVQSVRTDTTGNVGTYPKSGSLAFGDALSNSQTIPINEAGSAGIAALSIPYAFNGTTWDRVRGNATGGLYLQGAIAHDAVDSGNPVKIGGKARSSAPADVAASDRVDAYFDLKGRLKVDASDVAVPITDNGGSLTVDGTVAANVAATTGTLANGAETAVSSSAVQVLASNASRKGAVIQNTGSNNVRVGVSGVTATTGLQLRPGGTLTLGMPYVHTGAVFAIRESADSTVLAQEVT